MGEKGSSAQVYSRTRGETVRVFEFDCKLLGQYQAVILTDLVFINHMTFMINKFNSIPLCEPHYSFLVGSWWRLEVGHGDSLQALPCVTVARSNMEVVQVEVAPTLGVRLGL